MNANHLVVTYITSLLYKVMDDRFCLDSICHSVRNPSGYTLFIFSEQDNIIEFLQAELILAKHLEKISQVLLLL